MIQNWSIYEVLAHKVEQFIEGLEILITEHFPTTLISHPQLDNMLNKVKDTLQ